MNHLSIFFYSSSLHPHNAPLMINYDLFLIYKKDWQIGQSFILLNNLNPLLFDILIKGCHTDNQIRIEPDKTDASRQVDQ